MSGGFRVQPPEEWERLGLGEDDQDPYVAWVAAEDPEQARMQFLAYRAADDEYAIQLIRMGCIRGTLREVREAARIRPGTQIFRTTKENPMTGIDAPSFRRENLFVGTTADNLRVHIAVRFTVQSSATDSETTEHRHVNSPVQASITHSTYKGKKNIDRNLESVGDDLTDLAHITRPAQGFTLDEVRELYRLGTEWHLNDVNAACDHMDIPEGKAASELLDMGIVCPETGYKYGTAWLVRELPNDVYDRIIELASKGQEFPHED